MPAKIEKQAKKKSEKSGKSSATKKSSAATRGAHRPKKPEPKPSKPSSGQSGPRVFRTAEGLAKVLTPGDLNAKETRVYEALYASRSPNGLTLTELATKLWSSKAKATANSWVRNSLRRLVKGRLVEKVEEGTYRLRRASKTKKSAKSTAKKSAKVPMKKPTSEPSVSSPPLFAGVATNGAGKALLS